MEFNETLNNRKKLTFPIIINIIFTRFMEKFEYCILHKYNNG